MKKLITILAILLSSVLGFAQTDSAVSFSARSLVTLPNGAFAPVVRDSSAVVALAAASSSGESKSIDYNRNLVEMPAPDMAGLVNQVNASADLFTGKANANLPIYTLKSYDIEVPINLDYSANGAKVDEMGSWVGLGWNLNAGGAITRVMKNSPDESVRKISFQDPATVGTDYDYATRRYIWVYGYLTLKGKMINDNQTDIRDTYSDGPFTRDYGVFTNGFDINNFDNHPPQASLMSDGDKKKIADYSNWFPPQKVYNWHGDKEYNVGLDTEPDEFYFKFGSYAGKFVFNPDGQILCIPDYKFNITPSFKTVDGERQFSAFKVVTQEGYTYTFGDDNLVTVDQTRHRYFQETKSSYYKKIPNSERYNLQYQLTSADYELTPSNFATEERAQGNAVNYYTSAWHLNKIESPTNDVVTLSYDNIDLEYVDDRGYSASVPNFKYDYTLYQSNKTKCGVSPVWKGGDLGDAHPTPSTLSHFISIAYVSAKKLREISTSTGKKVVFKATADRNDIFGGKKLEDISLYLAQIFILQDPNVLSKKWTFNYLEKTEVAKSSTTFLKDYTTYKASNIDNFVAESFNMLDKLASGAGSKAEFTSHQTEIYKSEFNRTLLSGLDETGYASDGLSNNSNTIALYKLNYFNETESMPKRFSKQQDRVGYYNGAVNIARSNIELGDYKDPTSTNVSATLLSKSLKTIVSSNRNSDISFAKTYALQKITNSLNGRTEYSYAFVGTGGNADLKVSQINTWTGVKTQTKNFKYEDVQTSNAFAKKYQINTLLEKPNLAEGVVVYASKPYDLIFSHGSLFTSGKVTVSETGNGSVVSYLNNLAFAPVQVKKVGSTGIANECTACSAYPFPMLDDYDWKAGISLRTDVLNNNGKTLKQTSTPLSKFVYLWNGTTSTTTTLAPFAKGLKGARVTMYGLRNVWAGDDYPYATFSSYRRLTCQQNLQS